jgi:hypothetical protein
MRLRGQVIGALNLFRAVSGPLDQAFTLLRDHARETNQRLTDTARNLVDSATADFPPKPAAGAGP